MKDHQVVLLSGETGCGKSTQVRGVQGVRYRPLGCDLRSEPMLEAQASQNQWDILHSSTCLLGLMEELGLQMKFWKVIKP